jgi:uncharacterized protein YdeI (BOF family)
MENHKKTILKRSTMLGLMSCLIIAQLFAQDMKSAAALRTNLEQFSQSNAGNTTVMLFDDRYEGIKGTPFVYADWRKSTVMLKDSSIYYDVDVILGTFENVFYMKDGKESLKLDHQRIDKIIFKNENRIFVNTKIRNLPIKNVDFVELLVEGRNNLYVLKTKKLIKADLKGGYADDVRYDEYVDTKPQYFFQDESGKIHIVKLNKKDIFALFPNSQPKIESIVNTEKLDLKSEISLIKIILYRNAKVF